MSDENRPDISAGTIGTGCATGAGVGCLQILAIGILISASGVQITRDPSSIPEGIRLFGLLSGLAINVVVGYVTARKAPHSKMLHALIVGILCLVLGIMGLVIQPAGKTAINMVGFILSVPLVMLGAHLAISAEEKN